MKVITKIVFFLLCGVASTAVAKELTEKVLVYRGTSDASAAVAVSKDMFIVADDENNVLRVYKTNEAGPPVFSYDLTDFLDIESEHPEADIEGATIIADRIYWITSHGRDKDGQLRPNRYHFFAITLQNFKFQISNFKFLDIRPVGVPCKTLVHSLIKTETMRHLGLDKVTRLDAKSLKKKDREKLAPKEDGLNIEGLCASADGETLYIGFRNPRPDDKALVVPLKNAAGIVERSDEPIFGQPMLWGLGSLGIRSMEYSPFHKAYFILAGPHDETPNFVLYRWSGNNADQPRLVRQLRSGKNDFTPEALVCFRNSGKLLVLSDDGSLPIRIGSPSECMQGKLNDDGACPNKFLTDPNKKTFRAIWLTP